MSATEPTPPTPMPELPQGEGRTIALAALVLGTGNVASRLLGLVREQVIAAFFGLTAASDAFTAASRVPSALYDLLVGGMISAALVPVFSDYLSRQQRAEFQRVFRVLATILAVATTVIVVLGVLGAEPLMDLLAPEYPPETRAVAAGLLRIMMPALWFLGLSALMTAYHFARRRFALPAVAAGAYNLGVILSIPLLVPYIGVYGLAVGVVVGTLFQVLVQFRDLDGLRAGFSLAWQHPGVGRIYRLYLPVAAGLVVAMLGVAIDTNLASRTGEGSMAAMRFATTLVQFPLGMVATAVSFAVLPTLSRYAAGAEPGQETAASVAAAVQGYRTTLALGIKLVLLVALPSAAGLVVLREPVVQLLFQRGAFTADDSARTALAFLAYSPGLVAAAIDNVLIVAFYARKDTVTPVLVGVAAVGMYLATALALLEPLGMVGLVLANTVQWTSHAAVMLVLLGRRLGGWHGMGIGPLLAKTVAASGLMAVLLLGLMPLLETAVMDQGTVWLALRVGTALAAGALTYGGALMVLRTQEVWLMLGLIKSRLGW